MITTYQKSLALGICQGRAVRQWQALADWLDGLATSTPGKSVYHRSAAIKAKLALAARVMNHDPDVLDVAVRAAVLRTEALAALQGG